MRLKADDLWPLPDKWFIAGIIEHRNGMEEHFVRIKLPSWGMFWDATRMEERWGQRVLHYYGHTGFRILPFFK